MNPLLGFSIVVLIAIGIVAGVPSFTNANISTPDGDNLSTGDSPTIPQHIDSSNQSTWPSGDRIWDCCRAIAIAEGYNVPNSNPANLNNPGDISDGSSLYGSEFHSGSSITHFPNATTGWSWLYNKLKNAVTGKSSVYSADMSWNEIGMKWAPPNASVWASNVANYLGVDPDSSLGDYINA